MSLNIISELKFIMHAASSFIHPGPNEVTIEEAESLASDAMFAAAHVRGDVSLMGAEAKQLIKKITQTAEATAKPATPKAAPDLTQLPGYSAAALPTSGAAVSAAVQGK